MTSGTVDTASWTVKNVSACGVMGTNGDQWGSTGDGHFSDQTSAIKGQTTFTLNCTGLDGGSVTASAMVNLIPAFHEP